MTLASGLAIYTLFWVLSGFLVLPFGVRTHDELGMDKVAGQADSAPGNFRPRRVLILTTVIASVLFGLYYANLVFGWISADMVDISPLFGRP